ncbi:MAG: hypothetical protein OXF22_09430 [Anaerolineaceae bacterium]|nr:hypothetical protein [Anaerolineaceae bacterium]
MITEILANSWRLLWDEKRLMLFPLGAMITSALIGCCAVLLLGGLFMGNLGDLDLQNIDSWSGADFPLNETSFDETSPTQWLPNLLATFIFYFFYFATLSAVFRVLAGETYTVSGAYERAWSRLGRIFLFTLIHLLIPALGSAITFFSFVIFPDLLAVLLSFVIWLFTYALLYFMPTIAVAEETGPIAAIQRSWQLVRTIPGTVILATIALIACAILAAIGLAIGAGILFLILSAFARALIALWALALFVAIVGYFLCLWVFSTAFSAQLYQYAVAQLDGESPYTPDDIDEDAFHKAKF